MVYIDVLVYGPKNKSYGLHDMGLTPFTIDWTNYKPISIPNTI